MTSQNDRWIEYMPLADLIPAVHNPKRHDLPTIRASITSRSGLTQPVAVLDERTGQMIAGHGRRQVMLALEAENARPPKGVTLRGGVWLVPVARGWRSRNAKHAEATLLGDNQTTIIGGWEPGELAAALERVGPAYLDGTGFTLEDLPGAPPAAPDPEPERVPAPKVCKPGDLWQIGPHRLLIGDCRNPEHVARLLDGAIINLGVTSPPYADRRRYDETTEFKPIHPNQYVKWFAPVAKLVAQHLAEDGSWCVNIKPGANGLDRDLYVMDLVIAHVREWDWHLADEFCWTRNGVPKQPAQRLKNQFEPIYHLTRGRWKFRPDNVMHETDSAIVPFGPGRGNTSWADPDSSVVSQGQRGDMFEGQRPGRVKGRGNTSRKGRQGQPGGAIPPLVRPRKNGTTEFMSDVQGTSHDVGAALVEGMAYPGNLLPTYAGTHEAVGHPAAYPIGLPGFFTQLLTDPGDVVYDPFTGSGSTLLAAHEHDRIGYGIELSPTYCDEALARIIRDTDLTPIRHDGQEYPA